MKGKKEKNAVYINYVFPRDYELLERMLTANKTTLKQNDSTRFIFEVHPEWDLPSKLRSLLLSKEKEQKTFSKYYKKSSDHQHHKPEANVFSRKGDSAWKDYLFEMPNIRQILGIHRDFTVHNLEDVFQNPLLFLLHLYLEVGLENIMDCAYSKYGKVIAEIIEKAISKYEERKSADFTFEQIEYIFVIFLGMDAAKNLNEEVNSINNEDFLSHNEIIKCFGEQSCFTHELKRNLVGWNCITDEIRQTICRYKRIEFKINKIIESFCSKSLELEESEMEEIKIKHKKGAAFYLPEYMSPIFIGIHAYSDYLPFKVLLEFYDEESDNVDKQVSRENNKKQTLWSKLSVRPINDIDEEQWKSYCNIYTYTNYKQKIELCYAKINKISDISRIYLYLRDVHIFYICVLAKVFLDDNKKYGSAALHAFERMFSLYLFRVETDLIYEKIKTAGELLKRREKLVEEKKEDYDEKGQLEIAKYVVRAFSADVLYDIYCSPGLHHRICLAKHINDIDISPEDLAEQYLENKECERLESSGARRLRRIIDGINKKYFCVEEKSILEYFSSTPNPGITDLNKSCQENDKKNGFWEFYAGIEREITGSWESNEKRFNLTTAKKIADKLLNEKDFRSPAYKLIHFWVIFSSYFPREFSWVTLKNE